MRLAPLESVLNRNIGASTAARELLQRLQGKTLAVHITGLPASLYFRGEGEQMSITSSTTAAFAGEPDATLSGSPLALLNLAGAQPQSVVRAGTVRIEGDAEIAQAFRDLLKQARPELEEELSRVIGDVAAHQVGNFVRSSLSFGRRAAGTFAQNIAEFLQEEGRDVPSRTEAEEFIAGVDKLRDDVERLEARFALIERRQVVGGNDR